VSSIGLQSDHSHSSENDLQMNILQPIYDYMIYIIFFNHLKESKKMCYDLWIVKSIMQ